MRVIRFHIEQRLVKKGQQVGGQFLEVSNACRCGCSPLPFVSLSDGKTGLTARFQEQAELERFKEQVRQLQF